MIYQTEGCCHGSHVHHKPNKPVCQHEDSRVDLCRGERARIVDSFERQNGERYGFDDFKEYPPENEDTANRITEQEKEKDKQTAIAGGACGVAAGATAGAVVGSIFPGIGTIVGAVVGGIVGGMAGLIGGLIKGQNN